MNTKELIEGNRMTVEFVSNLPLEQRTGVIIEAKDSKGDFGMYPQMTVEINGRRKVWNMNSYSCEEFGLKTGSYESDSYVGLKVRFTIITKNGKTSVLGIPVVDPIGQR